MHFFRQIKISIRLFFDTLFRKYIGSPAKFRV